MVETTSDLQAALSAPNDAMIFVESLLDPCDALAPVTNSSNKGADLNYGPRGPNTARTCSSGRRQAHTVSSIQKRPPR